MTEAKVTKKRMHEVLEDGTIVVKYPALGKEIRFNPMDYPEATKRHWLIYGAVTATRSATIGTDEEGTVGTPDQMYARETRKHEQWKQGILRVHRVGEERAPTPTILVEAALLYKQMQAKAEGREPTDTLESVAERLEEMEDERYAPNPKFSKLDVLKESDGFKAAWAIVKERRAAAKAEAARKKLAESAPVLAADLGF